MEIKELMEKHLAPFKPYVSYNKHFDGVTVKMKDCRWVESPLTPSFSVLNRYDDGVSVEKIGFVIKNASSVFSKDGIDSFVEILNQLLTK